MTERSNVSATPETIAQNAVNETGFGKFNLKIMAVCGLIYMNVGFGYGSLGLVVPSAACDFEMTTIDKSRLSIASAMGMLCGSYLWGCTADAKGRKFALLASLFLHGGFDSISAVSSNYWVFASTKFFSGLGLCGQMTLIFPYLGEFQPSNVRDRILTWMEMAWAFGFTLVPLIGWLIIPLDFQYRTTNFFFRSWNLFMLICSFPAIVIGAWLLFLPETPKYLAENGRYSELLQVLETMYSENNGVRSESYSEKLSRGGNGALTELANLAKTEGRSTKNVTSAKEKILGFWKQTVAILRPPYLSRTLVIVTVTTCLMSSYFTLVLWLPEVFNRFAAFEALYPGQAASVCTVSQRLYSTNVTNQPRFSSGQRDERDVAACEIGTKEDAYLHTMILGLACVPTAIWLPLFVDRLGYAFHLVFGSFLCAAVTLGLLFVTSSLQNLVLACIFEAVSSICVTAVLCMLVELYPTNLRVTAAAFSTFIGRIGCFVGNGLFGYLIDDYCVPLISVIVGQLFLSGLLSVFIPRKSRGTPVNESLGD